jgi:hypothetical protein
MIIQMKIKQIWEDLANDKSLISGLLFRRYSSKVKPDIFIALQLPENILCIYVSISKTSEVNISNFSNLQEIQVDLFSSPNEADKNILIFKLLNFEHKDIFAVLCEDLITSISNETNEKKIIREVLNRFEKWKSLFNKIILQGLRPEQQRGLFGELYFLRKFLQKNTDFQYVISTWIGTEKQIRDFQNGSWAVEVKTTHGNNHQKIHINSERQLDTANLETLFLYHISLEQQQNSGESLNDIVDSIADILRSETVALNKFKSKIYEVGYFELQRNLYEKIGYHIRQDVYYTIENDFPRIEESDIRSGVGDVEYSIIISQCEPFQINEADVFDKLIP